MDRNGYILTKVQSLISILPGSNKYFHNVKVSVGLGFSFITQKTGLWCVCHPLFNSAKQVMAIALYSMYLSIITWALMAGLITLYFPSLPFNLRKVKVGGNCNILRLVLGLASDIRLGDAAARQPGLSLSGPSRQPGAILAQDSGWRSQLMVPDLGKWGQMTAVWLSIANMCRDIWYRVIAQLLWLLLRCLRYLRLKVVRSLPPLSQPVERWLGLGLGYLSSVHRGIRIMGGTQECQVSCVELQLCPHFILITPFIAALICVKRGPITS